MDIWGADKLVLFIAFVVPGFISLKTYALLIPRAPRDASQQLIDAVAYSCINYAILLWPMFELEKRNVEASNPTAYVAFYVFALLVAPIIWVCLLHWFRTTQLAQAFLPHPDDRPWDFVFKQRRPYWAIVTLKDGKKIGGRFARGSFASSAPAPEQIFLEERWELNADGGFERALTDSAGVLILATDIITIELFNLYEVDENEQQESVEQQPVRQGLATPPASLDSTG